jgi:hypothetical protein
VPQSGWLKHRNVFSLSSGVFMSMSTVSAVLVSSEAFLWLTDSSLLRYSHMNLSSVPALAGSVHISFCKDISQIRLGPILTISFSLNHFFKDPLFKCRHILKNWGLGFPHTNFEGIHFSPNIVSIDYVKGNVIPFII